jgi:acetoacetyl-CoA reductase
MPRVALVTGGTRGIGAAICKALKAAGYTVAANYGGNDEAAQKFKTETGINVYKWDVSSFEACAAGVKQVEADLGPIDVLVNNAGITRDSQLHRMKPEQWTAVINTNLGSLFNMCRQVIEGMRERKFGRIVNISSINGQKGQFGQVNYSASKAGEIGFTKALAQEGARAGVTSRPTWSKPCRRKFCRRTYCRRFRSAGSASRKKSRAASCSLPTTMPG